MTEDLERKIRILVIDDNPAENRLLKEALNEGTVRYIVDTALNPNDALILMKTNSYRIVFSDTDMNNYTGYEYVSKYREEIPTIRVVGLSTNATEQKTSEWLESGANAFLEKPVELDANIRLMQYIAEQVLANPDTFYGPFDLIENKPKNSFY